MTLSWADVKPASKGPYTFSPAESCFPPPCVAPSARATVPDTVVKAMSPSRLPYESPAIACHVGQSHCMSTGDITSIVLAYCGAQPPPRRTKLCGSVVIEWWTKPSTRQPLVLREHQRKEAHDERDKVHQHRLLVNPHHRLLPSVKSVLTLKQLSHSQPTRVRRISHNDRDVC